MALTDMLVYADRSPACISVSTSPFGWRSALARI